MKGAQAKEKLLLALLVFCVAAGLYANTLNGEFIKDDIYQVLRNEWIRDFSNIKNVFLASAWGFMEEGGVQSYYRPWMHLFYMASYAISELEPWGFHLVNIVLHALNSSLVFLVALSLFSMPREAVRIEEGVARGYALPAAFIAALLFAAHPVNTEAVAWVAAVPELSFTLFSLLAVICYLKGDAVAAAVLFFVAIFAKETAMVLPIIFVAFDLALRRESIVPLGLTLMSWIRRYAPFALGAAVYLGFRFAAVGGADMSAGGANLQFFDVALNMPPFILDFFEKLLIPTDLVYFHHLRFELIGSLFEARGLFYAALVSVFIIFMAWSLRYEPVVFFLLCWVLAPLVPIVALSFASGMPMFSERYLYFSSIGFTLLLLYLTLRIVATVRDDRRRRTVAAAALVAFLTLAAVYSVSTVKRNGVWHTSLGLWADVVEKAPENMTARLWYGNELAKVERIDEAIETYREAIRISPNDDIIDGIHNNLGIAYAKKGDLRRAAMEFKRAVEKDPENKEARRNLEAALGMINSGERQ